MLKAKNIYAIYLLHQVNELFQDIASVNHPVPDIQRERFMAQTRLSSYLDNTERFRKEMDDESVSVLLDELNYFFDVFSLPKKTRKLFPCTLHQFNKAYVVWRKEIKKGCK